MWSWIMPVLSRIDTSTMAQPMPSCRVTACAIRRGTLQGRTVLTCATTDLVTVPTPITDVRGDGHDAVRSGRKQPRTRTAGHEPVEQTAPRPPMAAGGQPAALPQIIPRAAWYSRLSRRTGTVPFPGRARHDCRTRRQAPVGKRRGAGHARPAPPATDMFFTPCIDIGCYDGRHWYYRRISATFHAAKPAYPVHLRF